jgi:hypothetical protein
VGNFEVSYYQYFRNSSAFTFMNLIFLLNRRTVSVFKMGRQLNGRIEGNLPTDSGLLTVITMPRAESTLHINGIQTNAI